jgi:hypothetical protein
MPRLLPPTPLFPNSAQKREVCVCYTYDDGDAQLKSTLYAVVQQACDEMRDAAGRPRVNVRSADHGAYLNDDDEEEDGLGAGAENEDSFFGAIVAKGGPGGVGDRSAADRLKSKDGNSGGGGGWFSSLTSWW